MHHKTALDNITPSPGYDLSSGPPKCQVTVRIIMPGTSLDGKRKRGDVNDDLDPKKSNSDPESMPFSGAHASSMISVSIPL